MTLRAALPSALRRCALGWAWLALLWAASTRLEQLAPWQWLVALALLTALPARGLWLGFMLRKRLQHAQFAAQGWVVRWFSGGLWQGAKAVALAALLCAAALWQGWLLADWEWALLAGAPPLHALAAGWLQQRLAPQFALPAYAWRWSQRLARVLLALLLGAIWLAWWAQGGLDSRDLIPATPPQVLDAALARIAAAPSGLVRWGLDALLALQIGTGAALALPESPAWRLLLLALTGPVGLLWCLGWALQGASGSAALLAGWRGDDPQPSGRRAPGLRAAVLALVGVLLGLITLQSVALLDGLARQHASPLALQRLPQCERIGQQFYRLGTLAQVQALALELLGQARAPAQLCSGLAPVRAASDAALERYLDWYFSLGAEWGRIYHLLQGRPEVFLQQRLEQTLAATPGLQDWLGQVQRHAAGSRAALDAGQRRLGEVLARHHLALGEGGCLVQRQAPALAELPELALLGSTHQRLAASAVAGAGAGGFAAVVAAKAAGKASMKAAAKVLAKAAAKQAAGKLGGAGAGALAGAAVGSALPGAGTAVGAAVGAAVGLATGVAIDWTLLRAEELLTRQELREQLRAVLDEQLDAVAAALACPPGP